MGAVPEAIAEEKLHDVKENVEELQQQQPTGDDEAPSSVDEVVEEIGEQDRVENGVLDDAAASQERDDDENSSENSVSSAAAKVPIVGGASPSEATSEWPEQGFASSDPPRAAPAVATTTKTVSTHYLVKIPRRGDNLGELKAISDMQVKENVEKRNAIASALQLKRAQRAELLETIKEPQSKLSLIRADIREKIEEQKPLLLELSKIKELPSSQDSNVCRTEEDLDAKLAALERDLQQHDRPLSLRDEKRIVREIQALKGTREQVIVNSSFRASKEDARQGCQSRLKVVNAEINALMASRDAIAKKIKPVGDKCAILAQEIGDLVVRKKELDDKIKGVFTERRELSSQEYAKNSDFFQNRRDISAAKQLAFNQEKAGLEELASAQVERVMTLWNRDDLFRLEYVKDNIRSTIRRLGTPDGRSLGPNEAPYELPKDDAPFPSTPTPAPVVERESKVTSEVKVGQPSKATTKSKETKEETSVKEPISRTKEDTTEKKTPLENRLVAVEATPEAQHVPEPEEELALLQQERDRRRVVEMEKAREADVRKKRLAEKKQAKAQARLEKEQQRKEKEKEKKQRKKAGNVTNEEEETDPSVAEEKIPETAVASENGVKASPEEKNASRRGKSKRSKSQGSSAVKLQIKRKRSFQRQLYDHWQLIAAAFGLTLVILVAATMFVRV